MVGLFAILVVLGAIGFTVFSAKKGTGDVTRYAIAFRGGVSGLSVGSDVRLNGLKVGQVASIRVDHDEPSLVRVVIQVANGTPIRRNSEASLELQGLTGLAAVAISGGTASSPLLKPGPDQEMAVIPARISKLEAFFAEVPQLVTAVNELVNRANGFLTPENQENFSLTMSSLAVLSTSLAKESGSMERIIENAEVASLKLKNIMDRVDSATDVDLRPTLDSAAQAAKSLDKMIRTLEPELTRFAHNGLEDLRRLMAEARETLRTMTRLILRLEDNPRMLIFGDNLPEYQTK